MRRQSLLLPLLLLAVSRAAAGSPLSAEELFHAPPLGDTRISPDGRHLGAVLTDERDVRSLVVYDLSSFKPEGLKGTQSFGIASFSWMGSGRVVVSVARDRIHSWGLYAAELGKLTEMNPIDSFDAVQIVGFPQSRPDRVIAWIVSSSADKGRPGSLMEFDATRFMDTRDISGRYNAVMRTFKPPGGGPVIGWKADRSGELALCETWSEGKPRFHRYVPSTGSWLDLDLPKESQVMECDFDPALLWIVTYSQDAGFELRTIRFDTGELGAPVLADKTFNPATGRLVFSQAQRKLAGIIYQKRSPASVWFLKEYASAQAAVDRHLPATRNVLVDHDDLDRKFVYASQSSTNPGMHEILDREARTLNRLDDAAPWLEGRPLRPVQPIRFKARDGLQLEGYLAVPEDASTQHKVPLVVLVHGGPWVRDSDAFSPEVQFLVSRGYAVLQPNYRGSSGYTPEVSLRHNFDFEAMRHDVADATRSTLETGIVDPRRVAIMGASFGGYLAVAGVAFEGDLYRCAITECGVFDWKRHIEDKGYVGRPGEHEILVDELGDPGTASARLDALSPLGHADRIRVPVLIAHGDDDQIADVAQSKRLAAALRRNGVSCETFFRAYEGHGFFSYQDRVDFFHRVEAFLAANLGGATLTRTP